MDSVKLLSKGDANSFETRFFNLFETINDMFIISSLDGKIIYCNKSLINKMEYSFKELKTMNILDLHPQEKREEASIILEQMLEGKRDSCMLEAKSKSGLSYEIETRIWFGKWNKEDCIYCISRDVTRENENLRLIFKIFENNPMPMIITDIKERKFIKVNPMFLQKTGYLQEEILGKKIEEIDFIVDEKRLEQIRKKALDKGSIKDEELVIRCKDGKLLKGLFSIEEINNHGKKSFLIVMVDITEKEELMEKVEDKCKKLVNIIEGTNLGTWEWDIQTGEVEFNQQWANMIGYSLEELEPTTIKTWERFVHPEDLKDSTKMIKEHLQGLIDHYDLVVRMKHRDGKWIWVRDRGKITQRDRCGNSIKMFGTHSDVTVKQEQALELERFFSINLDLLCITDIEGRFIKTNKAWEDILGYSTDKLKGRKFFDFIHPDDIPSTLEIIEKFKKGLRPSNFINRYISQDGNYHYIEWRSNCYEDLIYSSARDVTERIEYEEKILQVSNIDYLTNIYNRRYVYNRAEEIIEKHKKVPDDFSICIIDIDHFKKGQ